MPLIQSLLLLLIVSRIAGEIAERYGQPAILGEIAAGVLVGPSVLNYLQLIPISKPSLNSVCCCWSFMQVWKWTSLP